MPGLVPGIHVFLPAETKTWMAGTSPAMTNVRSLPREVKILAPRGRAVSKRLLLMPGCGPDFVADDVEQFSHLDMLLDLAGDGGGERAVLAFAVERGLAVFRRIDHHEAGRGL